MLYLELLVNCFKVTQIALFTICSLKAYTPNPTNVELYQQLLSVKTCLRSAYKNS